MGRGVAWKQCCGPGNLCARGNTLMRVKSLSWHTKKKTLTESEYFVRGKARVTGVDMPGESSPWGQMGWRTSRDSEGASRRDGYLTMVSTGHTRNPNKATDDFSKDPSANSPKLITRTARWDLTVNCLWIVPTGSPPFQLKVRGSWNSLILVVFVDSSPAVLPRPGLHRWPP